jgi:hypothetical protein
MGHTSRTGPPFPIREAEIPAPVLGSVRIGIAATLAPSDAGTNRRKRIVLLLRRPEWNYVPAI